MIAVSRGALSSDRADTAEHKLNQIRFLGYERVVVMGEGPDAPLRAVFSRFEISQGNPAPGNLSGDIIVFIEGSMRKKNIWMRNCQQFSLLSHKKTKTEGEPCLVLLSLTLFT